MKLTRRQLRALAERGIVPPDAVRAGGRKYRNQPVTVDGLRFDSKKEARRYQQLKLMQAAGDITGLDVQRRLPVVIDGVHICVYVADFVYERGGVKVYEDVKSDITRRNPVYRLKRKLVRVVLGIDIVEV